ncbi:hypothetical protein ACX9NE_21890 [Mycobacterium sp. ML4]
MTVTRAWWAAALLVLCCSGIGPAGAEEYTAAERQIIALLPPGYTATSCRRATDPFPSSVASLDCTDDMHSDTPDYARFTLYDNLGALTADFYETAAIMSVSPCPGGNASPGTWDYGPHLTSPGGKIVCGSVEDRADIAWTCDAQLLLATVNGSPDLNDLYQWWQRYGAATG